MVVPQTSFISFKVGRRMYPGISVGSILCKNTAQISFKNKMYLLTDVTEESTGRAKPSVV
jgi:hypothetical protein